MRIPRLMILIGFCAYASVLPVYASAPEVDISYGKSLDNICAALHGYSIKPEWSKELEAILPKYRNEWASSGPAILNKVEELTNKHFSEKSLQAHVTLCDIPSNSLVGITVNMRFALLSFTSEPVSLRYKSNVLAHEILHKFIAEHPIKGSPLIQLHANEDDRVKNHLHLFALLKAVLLELGKKDALDEMIQIDSELPGGIYKRAWQLVNQTPDEYMRYVKEVRNSA